MTKIEERLLTCKAIFLNLSLQERATGLDDIVGDLSSFFGLPVYFWNLSKSNASRIILRDKWQDTAISSNTDSSRLNPNPNYTSVLTRRLQDRLPERQTDYQAQSFESIINALIQVYESHNTGIYIVENINRLLSSKTLDIFQYEQIKTWIIKLTQKARKTQDFYLILLGSSGNEWDFQELAPLVKLPYLNHQQIAQILQGKFARLRLKDSDKHELIAKAGHILTGMSKPELYWGIDNITNSLKENNSVKAYVDGLLQFKQEKLSGLGLSFLPPPEINTVGGMDILKTNIANLKILFSCDRQKYNLPQEQGWALVGVPGAGKSLVAKVMQSELALPMIYIPIDKVKDRGPAYLSHVLELCEAYAPNIVYIDELDKMFTGGDLEGDAATTLAVFLTWLQEKQAPCFVLATLNRLDTLPPELLRSGRFSEVFYVGFPQPKERREIYELYLKQYDPRYKNDILTLQQWRELIDESIRFTGAEIAAVVKKAYKDKFFERRKAVQKLEKNKFDALDLLKKKVIGGYKQKYSQLPQFKLDLQNYEKQISKILAELPAQAEQLDELYGQLVELVDGKECLESDLKKLTVELEQLVNHGYISVYETMANEIIGSNNIEAMIARSMVDFEGQEARIRDIEKLYEYLLDVQQAIAELEIRPLKIDFESVLDFTIAEIPLFERAVEKVMKIENRARKLCKPVSSKDTSKLIDKEPSFWQDMKPKEAVETINEVRRAEAASDGEDYEPIDSLDEAIDEDDLKNYWAF